jgi:hypothetical protein
VGGTFARRTSLLVNDDIDLNAGSEHDFSLDGCYDIPIGLPIDLVTPTAIIGRGTVERLVITAGQTSGSVRVISDAEAVALHTTPTHYVHNYILRSEAPLHKLVAGERIQIHKNKERRYPIGTPIDLAFGDDSHFIIVASMVVSKLTISRTATCIDGEILLVYPAADGQILTELNECREAVNRSRFKHSA